MPGGGNGSPVFLPGVAPGERDLASFSPWGLKESDTTEVTWHTHTTVYIRDPRPRGSMPSLLSQLVSGELRDTGSIPGSGRSPGEGGSNPFQHSCLEKKSPVVRGAWQVAKSWRLCTSMRVQVEFSLTPNSIDCKNIALRRPIQKFLAFGFLQKPVYLPHPELDLSYPFLLFPNIYPVFLPDFFPRS